MKNWTNQCHFGDVRDVLRQMIADGVKVNTIVTSPPYWGLRSYLPDGHPDKVHEIGCEPTFAEFLAKMVGVFDLCWQVLAEDGTMWVNMGDSYATRHNGTKLANATALHGKEAYKWKDQNGNRSNGVPEGFKNKDLIGQPWRLAFALQDAGWWLRSDIIWNKPNPMPESCKDRPTKAHEYLFLLARSEKYYFDFEAFQEPVTGTANPRRGGDRAVDGWVTGDGVHHAIAHNTPKAASTGVGFGHGFDRKVKPRVKNNTNMDAALSEVRSTRNRRTVWTIPTQAFHGAHFATFPEALVEPCILGGCPQGGTVLDIFFGSGTTGEVAQRLGMNFIGIDLNRANKPLQAERLSQQSLDLKAA